MNDRSPSGPFAPHDTSQDTSYSGFTPVDDSQMYAATTEQPYGSTPTHLDAYGNPAYGHAAQQVASYDSASYDSVPGYESDPLFGDMPGQQPAATPGFTPDTPPGAYAPSTYESGTYTSDMYDTGSYHTGTYDAGTYDAGSYDTGAYETAAYATDAFQPGTFDGSAHQGNGAYPTDAYGTADYSADGYGTDGHPYGAAYDATSATDPLTGEGYAPEQLGTSWVGESHQGATANAPYIPAQSDQHWAGADTGTVSWNSPQASEGYDNASAYDMADWGTAEHASLGDDGLTDFSGPTTAGVGALHSLTGTPPEVPAATGSIDSADRALLDPAHDEQGLDTSEFAVLDAGGPSPQLDAGAPSPQEDPGHDSSEPDDPTAAAPPLNGPNDEPTSAAHEDLAEVAPLATSGPPGGRGRRRAAKPRRSALLTVAVPSVAVMGVAGIAAASVGNIGEESNEKAGQAAPDPTSVKPSTANSKLDTQLDGVSADAGDFAGRASRTQERIDLKARQEAERKRKEAEAARKEAERPKFALPVDQPGLSAYYGQSGVNWLSLHTGIDFPVNYGVPVKAATDGYVTTKYHISYGNMMIVTAPDGTETWYCHLSSSKIRSGHVKAGDTIGYAGSSGKSTGPHLHFEVRPGGGSAIDPLAWFRTKGLDPT